MAAPKILIVPPVVGESVSAAQRAQLDQAIITALRDLGAEPIGAQAVATFANEQTLRSRSGSIAVAQRIGALAVLRYTVKVQGAGLGVQVAVYFTKLGKAVMLEREMAASTIEGQSKAVIEELLRERVEQALDAGDDNRAAAEPPVRLATIFREENPYAAKGLVGWLFIGAAVPLGDDGDVVKAGLRTGAELGYQLRLAKFQSLVIDGLLGFSYNGAKVNGMDGGGSLLTVLFGARYQIHLGRVAIWLGPHFGFGLLHASYSALGFSDSAIGAGFAMNFAFGADVSITRWFAAGVFFDVTKTFVSALDLSGLNPIGGGFDFTNSKFSAATFSIGVAPKFSF